VFCCCCLLFVATAAAAATTLSATLFKWVISLELTILANKFSAFQLFRWQRPPEKKWQSFHPHSKEGCAYAWIFSRARWQTTNKRKTKSQSGDPCLFFTLIISHILSTPPIFVREKPWKNHPRVCRQDKPHSNNFPGSWGGDDGVLAAVWGVDFIGSGLIEFAACKLV